MMEETLPVSVVVFHALNAASLAAALLLVALLATRPNNRLIIALGIVAILLHAVCLAPLILYRADPEDMTDATVFCWLQALSTPYLALVTHCLVLCTVLELWIVLRGSHATLKKLRELEANRARCPVADWSLPTSPDCGAEQVAIAPELDQLPSAAAPLFPGGAKTPVAAMGRTERLFTSRVEHLLKYLKSWQALAGSFLLPLVPTLVMLAVLVFLPGADVEANRTMCTVVSPRWGFAVGYCALAVILMLPMIALLVHLVFLVFHTRTHNSDVLIQSSVTVSVCVRLVVFSVLVTIISGIVDIWSLLDAVLAPMRTPIDEARSAPATVFDYAIAVVGISLFLVFGTKYDVARLYLNPVRRLFGRKSLPPPGEY